MRIALAALALPAAACAHLEGPPPSSRAVCDAGPAQPLVGQAYTHERGEWARRHSGARIVQAVGPDDIVTLVFDRTRLTIVFDADNKMTRISCG